MVSNGKKYKIKKWHFYLIGFVVAFSFVLKGYYYYWPKTNILINGTIQEVLLADNYRRWNVGLSKRKSMNKYPGMIFVFPNRDRHVMVMRDMNFPLDMLWIDSGKVVEIIENIQ